MASELTEPATDEELTRLRDAIQQQRSEIRAHLVRELGGSSDDYHAARYFANRTR